MSAPRFRLVQGPAIGERAANNSTPTSNPASPPENPPRIQQIVPNVASPAAQMRPSPGPPPQQQIAQYQPPPVQQIPQQIQPQPVQIQPQPPVQQIQPQPPVQQQPPQPQDIPPTVSKCVRFLKTLINLARDPNSENSTKSEVVKNLITQVIYTDLSAEEFTTRLQAALQSQAQPHLLPFLQNTVPALRHSVRTGGLRIEGISPPPGFVYTNPNQPPPPPPPPPPQIQPQPQQNPQLLSQLQRPPTLAPAPPQNLGAAQNLSSQVPSTSGPPELSAETSNLPENQQQQQQQQNQRVLQEPGNKHSCLNPQEIMNRITARIRESCMVEEEALSLISDAAEYNLREIITQLAAIAEHRTESTSQNFKSNNNYTPIDDTKRQLRFLEEVDRQEEELRESREKETLIRMSKSKNIGKETIEKAKEMQRADAEAKRNRDANSAAIAALANNKTVQNKWDSSGPNPTTSQKTRTIRVNTRDLHLVANNDNRFYGTFLREKLAYGGPSLDPTI